MAAPAPDPGPSVPESSPTDPPRLSKPPALAPSALRTSQRVILHLSRQPRLGYGDVAPREITQAGMTEALAVPQPALTKVLARLVDGGALLATRTHVSGAARRLKVYQLTAHGEAIARDLRRRAAPTPEAQRTPVTGLATTQVDTVRSRDARPSAET
jgi:DNA-binding MarR family transcriptional regulator